VLLWRFAADGHAAGDFFFRQSMGDVPKGLLFTGSEIERRNSPKCLADKEAAFQ
jgi:hypothetical protein